MRIRLLSMSIVVFLLVLVIGGTAPSFAQNAKATCDPASIIKKASALTSKGDNKADMDLLMKLAGDIHVQNVTCSGYTFSGNASKLIGPIELPKGNYKTTLTTRGRFTGRLSVLSGMCQGASSSSSFYSISTSEAINGAEAVIRSDGCRLVIETSNVRGPWTLTIEPLESTDPPLQ